MVDPTRLREAILGSEAKFVFNLTAPGDMLPPVLEIAAWATLAGFSGVAAFPTLLPRCGLPLALSTSQTMLLTPSSVGPARTTAAGQHGRRLLQASLSARLDGEGRRPNDVTFRLPERRKQARTATPMANRSTLAEKHRSTPASSAKRHLIHSPKRHQSVHWLSNLGTIPSSRTLSRISGHLSAVVAVACIVWICSQVHPESLLWLVSGLNTSMHSLVGGALGLLLVFRTNSGYDRFWEAQKIWGSMISAVREMSRMAHSSLTGWDREHFLQLLAAFPAILLQHLRSGRGKGSEDYKAALETMLPASDAHILWNSRHRPVTVCRMLGGIVQTAFASEAGVLSSYHTAGIYNHSRQLTALELNLVMANVKVRVSVYNECVWV